MKEIAKATIGATPPLSQAGTAELGARPGHDTNVDVALGGGRLYATHSYTPQEAPNSPDGTGDLVVLDPKTLAEVRRVPVGAKPRRAAVDGTTGRAYLLRNADKPVFGELVLVDRDADAPAREVGLGWGLVDVAADAALGRVYVADARLDALRILDLDGGEIASVPVGKDPAAVAADQTRGLAYVAVGSPTDNHLVVVDGAAGAVVSGVPFDATNVVPQDVAVDEALGEAYVACQGNVRHTGPSVFAITPATGTVRRLSVPTPARAVDVDPVVGQLYVGGEGRLYALDAAGGEVLEQSTIEGRPGRIAVDRATGIIYVGEMSTGRVVAYRSAVAHPASPPPSLTLSISGNGRRMNLFRQAADGTLETAAYSEDADWTGFAPVGLPPGRAFPPGTRFASLSPEGGRWWLFGVDGAGVLWGASGAGQAASDWHEIGTGFVPGAEVGWAASFSGGVLLFAVDATGTVRSFNWTDEGPGGSEGVHGGVAFAPGAPIAAVSRKAGHWDLFVLHPDGRVYTQWWSTDEDAPSEWGALDGGPLAPGTSVSALGRKEDQLDLFAVDPNGRVVSNFWNDEQGWHAWAPVAGGGGFVPGSQVAVTSAKPDIVNLFAAGNDARIRTTFWKAEDGWAPWRALEGPNGGLVAEAPGAAVVAGRRGFEELDLCWLAPNGEVGHGWWTRHQGNGEEGAWSFERGVDRTVGTLSLVYGERIETDDEDVKGDIRITLWHGGQYHVKLHMHGSGFDPYTFIVQAAVPFAKGPGIGTLQTYRAGRVDGWEPFSDEERSYDWADLGYSQNVGDNFIEIFSKDQERLIVSHAVKNAGIGGALESLVADVIEFFTGGVVLQAIGGTLVAALAIGRELEGLVGADLDGWAGFATITAASGGLYWLVLPANAVLIPLAVDSLDPAIGAEERRMREDEWIWADQIFRGTLPHYDYISITNLANLNGGAFVSTDGDRYLVHMGADAFEEPKLDIDPLPPGSGVPFTAPGQVFIHELTHVWDAFHSGPEWEWEAALAQIDPPDDYPDPNRSWTELGIEHKAIAVAEWYRENREDLDGADATKHRYFKYVENHVRKGIN